MGPHIQRFAKYEVAQGAVSYHDRNSMINLEPKCEQRISVFILSHTEILLFTLRPNDISKHTLTQHITMKLSQGLIAASLAVGVRARCRRAPELCKSDVGPIAQPSEHVFVSIPIMDLFRLYNCLTVGLRLAALHRFPSDHTRLGSLPLASNLTSRLAGHIFRKTANPSGCQAS